MRHADLLGTIPELLRRLPTAERVERATIAAAIILYGAGDIVTTIISMELGGQESTDFVVFWIEQLGYAGLIVPKVVVAVGVMLAALAVTIFARRLSQPAAPYRSVIYGAVAVQGALLTGWNSYVIYVMVVHGPDAYVLSPF